MSEGDGQINFQEINHNATQRHTPFGALPSTRQIGTTHTVGPELNRADGIEPSRAAHYNQGHIKFDIDTTEMKAISDVNGHSRTCFIFGQWDRMGLNGHTH